MEARIARIESDVAHLRSDVADIKTDVRSLRDKGDNLGVRLDTKIDAVWSRLDSKIDALASRTEARFDALADSIATAKVWALLLYITLATATFGTMARAFGWL